MKESVLVVSGWAHGIDAIKPMGDALADGFDVQLMTGAQILREQAIPATDYIITGSMGGLLAMEFLPAACQKLVLVSSTAKFCASEDYPCGVSEKVLRRMIVQLKRNPEAVLDEFFKNVHFPFRESRYAMASRKHAAHEVHDLVAGLEYLLCSDVRPRTEEIALPVLLLHGAEDRIIPSSAAEWLHARLPDSRLKIFENDGHALPAHHFESVMKSIMLFLRKDSSPLDFER